MPPERVLVKLFFKKRGVTPTPSPIIKAVKKSQSAIRVKQLVPRTDRPAGRPPLLATPVTTPPDLGGMLGMAFQGQVPGVGLAGSMASAVRPLAVTGLRAALRTPGVRQLAERLAGRPSLLPQFTAGEIARGALIAGGTAATIEGISALSERFQRPGGFPGQALALPGGPGGPIMPVPGTGRQIRTLPGVGGQLPAGTTIVKVWHTGTAQFARLLDGRIAVQRKDGTIKTYRPQKHIVIPRNPRVGTLIRADKRLDRLVKGLRKVVRSGKR